MTSHSWQSMKYRYKVRLAKKQSEAAEVGKTEEETEASEEESKVILPGSFGQVFYLSIVRGTGTAQLYIQIYYRSPVINRTILKLIVFRFCWDCVIRYSLNRNNVKICKTLKS